MIRWDAVAVVYGDARAVGPIDLDVQTGSWVGLIGPNGAGKSSLLRAALGLAPHTGEVRVGDPSARRGIDVAWMPQRPRMPEGMRVSDYVLLGRTPHLGYLGSEGVEDIRAADLAMAKLDIIGFGGRPLGTLSGGEAQRVVLARALAQEAPILLLDEPTASLDMGHALEVLEVVDALRVEEGLTVVTAVHDLTLAARFADRLVLLSDGHLVGSGTPDEVLDEELLTAHYGSGVRVIHDEDGPTVVPKRSQ